MSTGFILRAFLLQGELVQERRFAALPIRIGRNTLNDFAIPDGPASKLLSNFHARIEPAADRIVIRDLGSKNGVYVRDQSGQILRIKVDEPVYLDQHQFEFLLGPQVRCHVQIADIGKNALRDSTPGAVIGNPEILASPPSFAPVPLSPAPPPGIPPGMGFAPPPPTLRPSHGPEAALPDLPPLPPLTPSGPLPGLPPLPGVDPPLSPQRHHPAPAVGGFAPAPNVPRVAEQPSGMPGTGHFGDFPLESLALQGLRELAASLVPGKELRTSGDLARFLTKLHDGIEVFCRCFIPLREGHAQFVSSLDLQRAAEQRSLHRSRAYMAVEMARNPGTLAAALFDWTNESLDAHKAIDGIYADLMMHQVALLDGVMEGVRALLEELSPEKIEGGVGRAKLGFGLSNPYKTLWHSYCDRFDQLSEEKQAFSHIFGHEFAEAYREYRQKRNAG